MLDCRQAAATTMRPTEQPPAKLPKTSDEDSINFRPSTNFKYMKYCKGKVELTGAREEEEGGPGPSPSPTPSLTSSVNPPLPLGPPPPDSPPLVTPKEEVIEEEYTHESATEAPEEEGKERVMCRQFARGACTRGASCIYAHEIIVSQLPGIYTFCRDFQNSTCTFPRCKFVHATVFEKEYFYRTGFLPPHALAHLKDAAPALTEAMQSEGAAFPAPGPARPPATSGVPGPSGLGASTGAATLVHPGGAVPGFGGGAMVRPKLEPMTSVITPPIYRDSVERLQFPKSETAATEAQRPDQSANNPETNTRKCPNCEVQAFKLECKRIKKEQILRTIREYDKKIAQLDQCNAMQRALILTIMKNNLNTQDHNLLFNTALNSGPDASPNTTTTNGQSLPFSEHHARARTMLERAATYLANNTNYIPMEDQNKKMFAVLMRYLMNNDTAASNLNSDS